MIQLTPEQSRSLKDWFRPERPGPLIGPHVLATGHGAIFADRWPDPGALLASTAGNYTLLGDPGALRPEDLRLLVRGFVEAGQACEPLLRAAFPEVQVWERVILEPPGEPDLPVVSGHPARLLKPEDAYLLWGLSPESEWISRTWGGPPGLAASGCAWGAIVDGRLASVACTFFMGERYEDIGVVTEAGFRGRGLSTSCAAALCRAIRARGRRPSWTTSPDNEASLRVAEKLGFHLQRRDQLYLVGRAIPPPARREENLPLG